MSAQPPAPSAADALQALRQYREQLLLYRDIPPLPPDDGDADEDGPSRPTAEPTREPVALQDVPGQLRRLLADYERAHPEVRVVPVALFGSWEPEGELPTGRLDELPDEDEMVCFSVTETTLSASSAEVRTRTLVAAIAPTDAGSQRRSRAKR